MHRFKSDRQAQRFLSAHGPIDNLFRCRRNRLFRTEYPAVRSQAFLIWREITNTRVAS